MRKRQIKGGVKIVASNSQFIKKFDKISLNQDDLIEKLMRMQTTETNTQSNAFISQNTFESFFLEFTSNLAIENSPKALDITVDIPGNQLINKL